jgi:hypothetical protein
MANPIRSVKDKLALRTRAKRIFNRSGSEFIAFESFVSLIFFTLAFFVFLPLLRREGDLLKLLVLVYGLFVVIWGFSTIYDYLVKSSRLGVNTKLNNYSLIAGINTIIGLAIPLFVINSVTSILMHTLSTFENMGTALCEIRTSFVRFYYAANTYNQVSSLIFWVMVFALGLIVLGGLVERISKRS